MKFLVEILRKALESVDVGEWVRLIADNQGFRVEATDEDVSLGATAIFVEHEDFSPLNLVMNRELLSKVVACFKGSVELTANDKEMKMSAGLTAYALTIGSDRPTQTYERVREGQTLMLAHDEWMYLCDAIVGAVKARFDNPYKAVTVFPNKEHVDFVGTTGTFMAGCHMDGVQSLSMKHDLPLVLFRKDFKDVTITFGQDAVTVADDDCYATAPYAGSGVPDMYWQLLDPAMFVRLQFTAEEGARFLKLIHPLRNNAKANFRWYGNENPCVHLTTIDEGSNLTADVVLDGQRVHEGATEGSVPVFIRHFIRAMEAMKGADFKVMVSPSTQLVFSTLHRFALFMRSTVQEPV